MGKFLTSFLNSVIVLVHEGGNKSKMDPNY